MHREGKPEMAQTVWETARTKTPQGARGVLHRGKHIVGHIPKKQPPQSAKDREIIRLQARARALEDKSERLGMQVRRANRRANYERQMALDERRERNQSRAKAGDAKPATQIHLHLNQHNNPRDRSGRQANRDGNYNRRIEHLQYRQRQAQEQRGNWRRRGGSSGRKYRTPASKGRKAGNRGRKRSVKALMSERKWEDLRTSESSPGAQSTEGPGEKVNQKFLRPENCSQPKRPKPSNSDQ